MFSNLALYYLNQMGIQPWINRAHYQTKSYDSRVESQATSRLVILTQSDANTKSGLLLNKMLHYLNLSDDVLLVINTNDAVNNQWREQLLKESPKAIWSMTNESYDKLPYDCPIIASPSPEFLLQNPSEKRTALKHLEYLKGLLSSN